PHNADAPQAARKNAGTKRAAPWRARDATLPLRAMCSVLGILEIETDPAPLRGRALELSRRMRHRGPDWSGIYAGRRAILAHERLAIVDVGSGAQPLYSPDRTRVLAVNGEIYNHREIRRRLAHYPFTTGSDGEVILAL